MRLLIPVLCILLACCKSKNNDINIIVFLHSTQDPIRNQKKELRFFTNRKGVKIRASVESVTSENVTIKREDGKRFTLPISMLSDADGEFLKQWKESKREPLN